jgi:hypothetical protein
MYSRRSVSLLPIVWLVIGVLVAYAHHYFSNLDTLGAAISALLAVLLWPLILLGVNIAISTWREDALTSIDEPPWRVHDWGWMPCRLARLSGPAGRRVGKRGRGLDREWLPAGRALAAGASGLLLKSLPPEELVPAGDSNTEIGARLYVGDETVKTHVSRILAKLDLRDRVHAVVYAHRHGLIEQ